MIKKIVKKYIPLYVRQKAKDLLFGKSIEETYLVFKLLKSRKGPMYVMIDVGAHHGDSLLPFAQNQWTIFAFEPDPRNLQILQSQTTGYQSVNIDTRAVSDTSGQEVSFYTSNISAGISSMAAFHKSHVETAKVKTISLRDFFKEHPVSRIDFLKIDTEGFDLFVLKGFDWTSTFMPEFIVCEFENQKTCPLGYSLNDQCEFLEEKGYKLLISEWHPIIEYGKRHKWKGFSRSPRSVTNSKAWGNIIATIPENFDRLLAIAKMNGKFLDEYIPKKN